MRFFYGFLVFSFLFFSCEEQPKEGVLFELRTSNETGVDFSNDLTDTSEQNIIEYLYYYNGGGIAIGDINNDGLQDLFFTANQKPNKLFLNKGEFKFEDISFSAGISTKASWSTGVTMADVNGDGFLDIYVCEVGAYKSFDGSNKLYINKGDLNFEESSVEYGLNFTGFSTQTSFFDYDRDGDLDMYLLNHSIHTPRSYKDASTRKERDLKSGDRLFKNLLTEGKTGFEEVTEEAGIYSSSQGYGLGLVTSDINQDGWMDIYVGNDFHENDYLYINQGDGSFKESINDFIGHTSRFSMGVDVADINDDLLPDIISLDMLPRDPDILLKSGGEDNNQISDIKLGLGYGQQYSRNTVQINKGNGSFAEVGYMIDAFATDWSWSVLIQDFDLDGKSDFFISNGIYKRPNDLDYINYLSNVRFDGKSDTELDELRKELIGRMPTLKIPNYAFKQESDWQYAEVSEEWGLDEPSYSNGSAYGDLDNDGDLDLVINNVNQEAFIYENKQSRNNFVAIDLEGDDLNRFGIGARVELFSNRNSWSREVSSSRGFQSSSSSRLHFGLGSTSLIDSVRVYWPNGTISVEKEIAVNQLSKLKSPGGNIERAAEPPREWIRSIQVTHKENDFSDYKIEPLIPQKLSTEGPAFAKGDVDGDGQEEIFIGGSHDLPGRIFRINEDSFQEFDQSNLIIDARYEDVAAEFADVDMDGDLDLYVVSGGSQYQQGDMMLEDRIYLNDGTGNLSRWNVTLPRTNGSVVRIDDFDMDEQAEIYVGSRSVPGSYGYSPKSYLMKVGDAGMRIMNEWELGMVTDARWYDYNNDDWTDLVVVGEWMPVTLLENQKDGNLKDVTSEVGLSGTNGFWNVVEVADIDSNGSMDMVVGNLGLNSKLKPKSDLPVELYIGDFDRNNQLDPIFLYPSEGRMIPLASRDELITQLPFVKKTFPEYEKFSKIGSFEEIIRSEPIETKSLNEVRTTVYLNMDGEFEQKELPAEAQVSPVQDILLNDIDGDQVLDLILVGNAFNILSPLGRMDGSAGSIFKGESNGDFLFMDWLPFNNQIELRHLWLMANEEVLFIPNNDSLRVMTLPKKQ